MRAAASLLIAAWLGSPIVGFAQEPVPGGVTRVFVQREAGEELRGQVLQLGPGTMTLLVDGQRLSVPMTSVLRIETRGDSLRNGALIGAIAGGVWCALVCGQGLSSTAQLPAAVAFSAGFWAAAGVGIDAMIPGRTTIYRRPAPAAAGVAGAAVSYRLRF